MSRLFLALLSVCLLISCSERGVLSFAPASPNATAHEIHVANFRATDEPDEGQNSPPRPDTVHYEKYTVSVPPTHTPGVIAWPDGAPNAETDFVTVSQSSFDTPRSFAADIRPKARAENEVLLFVHGYNTNHAEALYLLTQVRHDFEVPVPTVLFSWPSAAVTAGYLYDRDSVLIARDHLEEVLVTLSRDQRVVIMGHSMGNLLIMETLRQIELSGSLNVERDIAGLFMISPDIDGELFRTQAEALRVLPDPSVIFAAKQDQALRVSAWLTGRTNRLGSDTDRIAVGDLPIAVVDVSAFSDGGLAHKVALQSPSAIALLNQITPDTIPRETQFSRTIRLTPDFDER